MLQQPVHSIVSAEVIQKRPGVHIDGMGMATYPCKRHLPDIVYHGGNGGHGSGSGCTGDNRSRSGATEEAIAKAGDTMDRSGMGERGGCADSICDRAGAE